MLMRFKPCLYAALLAASLLVLPALTFAEDKTPPAKAEAAEKTPEKAPPADVTTQGSIDLAGQHIAYTAVAGTITVGATDAQDAQLGLDGKPQPGSQLALDEPKEPKDAPPVARMFYVAYLKKDAKAEDRPITFFYNGGPGSSTVWLHMGSFGPKHVMTAGDQHLPAAPYKMIDNAYSLLDTSDLVFIDMPGTGFGRIVGKDGEKAFWGIDQDANAFARFIARFITKYNRWNSPKYLFGESCPPTPPPPGTTRSCPSSRWPWSHSSKRWKSSPWGPIRTPSPSAPTSPPRKNSRPPRSSTTTSASPSPISSRETCASTAASLRRPSRTTRT
jgi:hypothetical protein